MTTANHQREFRYWIDQLGSSNPIVRMQAVAQILVCGDQSASVMSALQSAVRDESPGVRVIAEWGLRSFSMSQPPEASIRSRLAACLEHADSPAKADLILPVVFEGLYSPDSSDRVQALRVIRLLARDAEPLLPTIEQCLHDENYLVRLAAILLIASPCIGYSDVVIRERLAPMIDDTNHLVRKAVKEIIG